MKESFSPPGGGVVMMCHIERKRKRRKKQKQGGGCTKRKKDYIYAREKNIENNITPINTYSVLYTLFYSMASHPDKENKPPHSLLCCIVLLTTVSNTLQFLILFFVNKFLKFYKNFIKFFENVHNFSIITIYV